MKHVTPPSQIFHVKNQFYSEARALAENLRIPVSEKTFARYLADITKERGYRNPRIPADAEERHEINCQPTLPLNAACSFAFGTEKITTKRRMPPQQLAVVEPLEKLSLAILDGNSDGKETSRRALITALADGVTDLQSAQRFVQSQVRVYEQAAAQTIGAGQSR